MKGVVFVLFEEFVVRNWGEATFEQLLDDCPHAAAEPFVSPKTYPDQWIVDLLTAACKRLAVAPEDALRAFGKFCFPGLAKRFPAFVKGMDSPRHLIESVNGIIHVEVRKLMDGAEPPSLLCQPVADDPNAIDVHYESRRGLCALMSGLLDGCAEHFSVPFQHTHTCCKQRGEPRCTFRVTFPALVPVHP
ncbi:MAG: heme NO-binding domain-containing protein [Planctomycetes bacterium]|nr:heme NO-binding domain-containing protein [Planctomycetota bacterium]